MRRTAKVKAAEAKCNQELIPYPHGNAEGIYSVLEEAGYKWDSTIKQWIERPPVDMTIKTGLVDIRVRAANGDISDFLQHFEQLLTAGNMTIIRGGDKTYPDDRHGIATTSRVYYQVKI